MKKSKGMQLGAMLAAVLLVSVVFLPAVSAKTDAGESNLSDPTDVKVLIEKLSKAGDKADKLYASLTPQEQASIQEYLTVRQVTTNETSGKEGASILAGGCTYFQKEISYSNGLGILLFAYKQKIDWCYDGSIITSNERFRAGETYAPFWSFSGHVGDTEVGGINQAYYQSWTQGEFKLCLGGDIGCAQYKYPWVDMVVYGDGTGEGAVGG